MWTPRDIPDQHGRVAVVTGGNSGLGFETARELAAHGATVVVAARDRAKAERARQSMEEARPAGAPGRVEVRALDLAALDAVRACAAAILSDHERVDLLVNNAGVMGIPERQTADGFETQLGVNHLGHFVLTRHLLPALLRAQAGRVVTVTSFARLGGRPVDPSNPHLRGRYGPWRAYNQSKLANLHFAVELQRRLAATGAGVASLAAHPGLSHTDLQTSSVRATGGGWSQRFWAVMARGIGMPPDRAAHAILRAATDPEPEAGALYGPRWFLTGPPVPRRMLRPPRGDHTAALWAVSERETGETFDVAGIVGEARPAG